jgi:hypothetical protein
MLKKYRNIFNLIRAKLHRILKLFMSVSFTPFQLPPSCQSMPISNYPEAEFRKRSNFVEVSGHNLESSQT